MEPALNNSSNDDFACLINLMSFSKIDELFKTLRLKDLKTDNITWEIPKDKPYMIGKNPKLACPYIKTGDISYEHCEIFYCYEDLIFVLKNHSKNGTWVYLKNKEFSLEKEMVFQNDKNIRFSVREFNNENKILTIKKGAEEKEIDLSKGIKTKIGNADSKMYLNNSGKPVLFNADDDGYKQK